MSHAGTRSFSTDVPLQRFFRDMNTLTSHAFIDWDVCRELFGRHRLGLEPNHPLL
jgi:3-hydroxy-9,10-secoandrosta-1,3,5(10)-triene-9,17-dione monooxygenase